MYSLQVAARGRLRTLALAGGALLAAAATSLAGPAPKAHAAPIEEVNGFAYAFLLNRHGGWTGPTNSNREPLKWVVDRIIEANPSHLRLTAAANTCKKGECYTLKPNRPSVAAEMRRLRDAGIKLGAAVNIARTKGGKRRTVKDVVNHACRIKKADKGNFYSWIFLDFSRSQPKRREIGNRIRKGTGCSAGGWKIVTNSSGYKRTLRMPNGAVAHAKRFSLLVGGTKKQIKKRLRAAANGKRSVLAANDRRFITDVKRKYPRSYPILKLEVPHQSGKIFAQMPANVQRKLLERWAKVGRRKGFKIIYPLFVFPSGNYVAYDSVAEGTYDTMVGLMELDNW